MKKVNKEDADKIVDLYINKRMSSREVGKIVGFSRETILRTIRKKGQKPRKIGATRYVDNKVEDKIIDLYINKKMSSNDVAKKINDSQYIVLKVVREKGYKVRNKKECACRIISGETEQQIIDLYINQKIGAKEVCKIVGHGKITIKKVIQKNGYSMRTKKEVIDCTYSVEKDVEQKIIKLYTEDKKNTTEIAKELKKDRHTISKILTQNNIEIRHGGCPPHLPEHKSEEVMKLYLSGNSIEEISILVGVSTWFVCNTLYKNEIERRSVKEVQEKRLKVTKTRRENGEYDERYIRKYGVPYREMTAYWNSFNQYREIVMFITRQQDIEGLKHYEKWGNNKKKNAHHLDHKFSIFEGFRLGVPPEIIGNIANLEFLPWRKNIQKSNKCSVTLEELMNLIDIDKVYV